MAQETVIKTQKKKKASGVTKHRRLFIALMLAYPILHFLVFWVYINFNTLLISFQNFSFRQGKEIWTGWDNYAYFFKELTKTGSQAVRYAIVNSVLFFDFQQFHTPPALYRLRLFIFQKGVRASDFPRDILSAEYHFHRRIDDVFPVYVQFSVRTRRADFGKNGAVFARSA